MLNYETIAKIRLQDMKLKTKAEILWAMISVSLIQMTLSSLYEPTSQLFTP